MFTGLVEEVGKVTGVLKVGHALQLQVAAKRILEDIAIGDSLAVNGVCLTVTQLSSSGCLVDVVPETVRRSTFSHVAPGHSVNLERAMKATDRFGGHMVAGHVDEVGTLVRVGQEDTAKILTIQASKQSLRYIVEKGSIAIDGISLTVMDVLSDTFRVSIIPHTAMMTTLHHATVGTNVNLEVDVIAKYVERLLHDRVSGSSSWTFDHLRELGY